MHIQAFESHRDHRMERRPKGGKRKWSVGAHFQELSQQAGSTGEVAGPHGWEAWSRGFRTKEPRRWVKGRRRREHSGVFREVLTPHSLTQREEVGQWETVARPPHQVLHVQYRLPCHTALQAPRCKHAVARAGIKLETSDVGSRLPHCTAPFCP